MASLETVCAVAGAVDLDLVVRAYPARKVSLRDTGQLAIAGKIRSLAHPSWQAALEVQAGDHGESADLVCFSATEILHTEIERWLVDFQAQYRSAVLKRDWLSERHARPVRLVLVLEDRPHNRAAVAPHRPLIAQALPAGTRAILAALRSGGPLGRDGLLWLRRPPPER
jgi:hypothetical protein